MISVLLDLDGTLIDSIDAVVNCWIRAGKKMGMQLDPNSVRELIGYSPRLHVLKYFNNKDMAKEFLRVVRNEFSKIWMNEVKPFRDSHEALKSLKHMKVKIGVISSNFKETVRCMLEYFGFSDFLDVLICDNDVKNGKPAPDIVLEAMKRLEVSPHECFVVGDTLFDVEAGKRAGALTVLVVRRALHLTGSKYIPDYVISNLQDVATILKTYSY